MLNMKLYKIDLRIVQTFFLAHQLLKVKLVSVHELRACFYQLKRQLLFFGSEDIKEFG